MDEKQAAEWAEYEGLKAADQLVKLVKAQLGRGIELRDVAIDYPNGSCKFTGEQYVNFAEQAVAVAISRATPEHLRKPKRF